MATHDLALGDETIRPTLVAFFANRPRVSQDKPKVQARTSEEEAAALKNWVPVNQEQDLLVNETLFQQGIIALVDPKNCEVAKIEANTAFAVSKERNIVFSRKDKVVQKANRFFNLPAPTAGLRHTHRRDECYVPVVVKNEQGKAIAGLYIHPRWLGQPVLQTNPNMFIRFHVETCLYGFQLIFHTNTGVRPLPKYSAEFSEGEYVKAVSLHPNENSYETMQSEELRSMASIMAHYSLKGIGGQPRARITDHLPWLDYIIPSSLLMRKGKMSYPALYSLCEMMLEKKAEREQNIGAIYHSAGLEFRFITPFDNLLDPEKALTAESILQQLGIYEEQNSQPFFDDLQQEKQFIQKCVQLLTGNSFDTEQKYWWQKMIAAKTASGVPVETLAALLEIANTVAVAVAAFPRFDDPHNSNACSFVSIDGKQIQVAYESFFKSGIPLPSLTFWTSLPLFFFNSPASRGIFYVNYLPHAKTISELIKHEIVDGAASNMAAHIDGQEGKSVQHHIASHTTTPFGAFFNPITDKKSAGIAIRPEVKANKTFK